MSPKKRTTTSARRRPAAQKPALLTAPDLMPGPAAVASRPPLPPSVVPAAHRARPSAVAQAPAAPVAPPENAPPQNVVAADEGMPAWAARVLEQVLTVTCWLDPGAEGEPFSTTVRFTGRRSGVTGKPRPGDTFTRDETVDRIVPGSGPVAVTTEVRGVSAGEWQVTARPVARPGDSRIRLWPADGARRVPRPRLIAIPGGPAAIVRTAPLPLTRAPGVIRFAYSGLIALGMLAGLSLEALLLSAGHFPVARPLAFSVGAVAAGLAGGKAWFIALHRGRVLDGWCIQGFIAAATAVVAVTTLTSGDGLQAGVYLSSAAAALLIGIAVGRPGCFWAGCCVGRPTTARHGIWASDRRVGCRREPAQLLEALAALVIGGAVLAAVALAGLRQAGPAAVAALAAYTLSRQLVLRLREEPPRRWRYGRLVTTVSAAAVLTASLAALALG